MATPLDTVKNMARSIVGRLPQIILTSSKSTHLYDPSPPLTQPENRYIRLCSDPNLPSMLLEALDAFLAGLSLEDLDLDELPGAFMDVASALNATRKKTLTDEASVQDCFRETVFKTVQAVCTVLKTDAQYETAPRLPNVQPDKAMLVNGEPVAIFEHKSPTVANVQFPEVIQLGIRQERLDLFQPAHRETSILSRVMATLALALISKGLEYSVLHSAESYIFLRIVRDSNQRWHMMISNIIRLTDPVTPVIPLILSLLLHSRKDGHALPSLSFEIPTTVANDGQPTTAGSEPRQASENGSSQPTTEDEYNVADQSTTSNDSSRLFKSLKHYWIPEDLNKPTLADSLGTLDTIPVCWKLQPYSEDVWYPSRQKDSSIWAMPGALSAKNLITKHLASGEHHTPPPLPPIQAFLLELHSNVGEGANGWAFGGSITGLPDIRLVAKLVSANQVLNELEIWKKLRSLAGIKIPGLYGAYVFDNPHRNWDRGFLLQQDAGHSIASYEALCLEQKQELFQAALMIHGVGIIHNDIRPSNVAVAEDGRVMIIDFDQARDHKCPGEILCEELRDLRSELGLPP
ncbi:hypothetical protein FRC00_010314, partial [Tulasnella sp. 408]